MKWIKIALVGDERVGKTGLVTAYAERRTPGGNEPKVYPAYDAPVKVNDKPYTLGLRDTDGIQTLSLIDPEIDLIMICFSVVVPTSFHNVSTKWLPEIRRLHPDKPVLLVGTQVDIREDETIMASMRGAGNYPITADVATAFASEIGALKYLECSATHVPAVNKVIDEAVRICIARGGGSKKPKEKSRSIFSLIKPKPLSKKTSLPALHLFTSEPKLPKGSPKSTRKQKHRANSTDLPDTPILVYERYRPSTSFSDERSPRTPSTGNASSIRTTPSEVYLHTQQDRLLPSEWGRIDESWEALPETPVVQPPSPANALGLHGVSQSQSRSLPAPTHFDLSSPPLPSAPILTHFSSSPPQTLNHLSASTSTRQLPPIPIPNTPPAVINGFDFALLYRLIERALPPFGQAMDWTGHVHKLGDFAIGGGNYGDVWQGGWCNLPRSVTRPPPLVAIKVIRPLAIYQKDGGKKAVKHLNQEIAVWHRLSHENIVPFIGVCSKFGPFPSLISLWMPNGTLKSYLEINPDADKRRLNLGVARGLEYLHSQKVIHGDLKAVNILVDENEQPCLSDFGLSRIVEEATGSLFMTSNSQARGTTRWMAPELLLGQEKRLNPSTDVYAYAMTVLEVLTGHIPFYHLPNEPSVLMALVTRKERPRKPEDDSISDTMWHLLKECWLEEPRGRPGVSEIISRIERMGR